MSAKHGKKSANSPARGTSNAPASVPVAAVAANQPASAAPSTLMAEPSWLDSNDPKKRKWGKLILVGLWVYVAALWLLALDQTFNWGIFGPKLPVP